MTLDETIQKLIDLKRHALAKSLREMMDMPPDRHLSFEDKLGLLVDQGWTSRENRRVSRRVQEAKLTVRAAPEEILCDSARGTEYGTLRELSSCQWVRSHHNLLLLGATGVGKSFLASVLPTRRRTLQSRTTPCADSGVTSDRTANPTFSILAQVSESLGSRLQRSRECPGNLLDEGAYSGSIVKPGPQLTKANRIRPAFAACQEVLPRLHASHRRAARSPSSRCLCAKERT